MLDKQESMGFSCLESRVEGRHRLRTTGWGHRCHNASKIKPKKYCSSVPEIPDLLKRGEVLPMCSCKGESQISPWEHFSSAQVSLQWSAREVRTDSGWRTLQNAKGVPGQQPWQGAALCQGTALSSWPLSGGTIILGHSLEKSEVCNSRKIDFFKSTWACWEQTLIPFLTWNTDFS